MKRILIVIFSLWAMGYGLCLHAQTQEELLQQLLDENRSSMEALVLYPQETRVHILEAAKYPEALIRIESMQSRTQTAFRSLIETYPERVQQQVWDLTRYPGLIERLVGEGRGSRMAINQILQDYPAEAREPALEMSDEQFGLLARIDDLERNADRDFRNFLLDYPTRTEAALRALVELPEVLTILTDNVRMTVLLGDLYKRDSNWMVQQTDSLSLSVARDRARDLESWKESLESNPDARNEFEKSAQAYAQEYGYDDVTYDYAPVERPQNVVVEHHYYYPYRYWFGYPYWYTYPRWRPVPYWYDWGFYMRPGGAIVVFDFPSYYFVNWYYRRPNHIYYYPRLAGHFADYYYGHRRSTSSIVVGVDQWKRRNAAVVSDTWLSDRNNRVERLREFGQMEESRETYNRANPGRQMPQREFVSQNAPKYPRLTERLPEEMPRTEPRRDVPRTQPPVETQRKDAPRTQPPAETPRTEPRKDVPRTQPPVETPRTEPRKDAPRTFPDPAPRTEPRAEPRKDVPRTQPPVETPRKEAPRTEPRKDIPRTQPPVETPRKEAPRTEPRKDIPRTQPQVETPRKETPRTQPATKREEPVKSAEKQKEKTRNE